MSISKDITYDNVGAATWSAVELNVGIICACFPAMRPVISLVFPHFFGATRPDNSSNYRHARATYVQNESVIRLSQVVKAQSEVSKGDSISFDHGNDPNMIGDKTEWIVTEGERV